MRNFVGGGATDKIEIETQEDGAQSVKNVFDVQEHIRSE